MAGVTKRTAEAFALRAAGLTNRQIADRLGVSRQRVHQLIGSSGKDPIIKVGAVLGSLIKPLTVLEVNGNKIHIKCACGRQDWITEGGARERLRNNAGCKTCSRLRKLTKEQEQEIAERALKGETAKTLSEEFRLSHAHVARIIRIHNKPHHKPKPRLTRVQLEEIVRRRLAGESGRALAKVFGVSSNAIYLVCKKAKSR